MSYAPILTNALPLFPSSSVLLISSRTTLRWRRNNQWLLVEDIMSQMFRAVIAAILALQGLARVHIPVAGAQEPLNHLSSGDDAGTPRPYHYYHIGSCSLSLQYAVTGPNCMANTPAIRQYTMCKVLRIIPNSQSRTQGHITRLVSDQELSQYNGLEF